MLYLRKEKKKVDEFVKDVDDLRDLTTEEFKQEGKESIKRVIKGRHNIVVTIGLVVIFLAIVIYTIIAGNISYKENVLHSNIMYQQELYGEIVMQDIEKILGVYNDETYEEISKSLEIDSGLYEKLFRESEYMQDSLEKPPIVSILNMEYGLTDEVDEHYFIVTASRQTEKGTTFYNIFVEVYKDKIASLVISRI